MQIRPGTSADEGAILEIYRQARAEPPSEQRLSTVAGKLAEEIVVVADDAGVVGFAVAEAAWVRDETHRPGMHVSMLFVAPARQRQGVGTALVEGLADVGWGLGFRTLSVWSGTPEFYEAAGLQRTDETQVLPDGRSATRLTAELEAPARQLVVDGPGIRLGQLLKFAGIVDTGGDAKVLLAAGGVEVNGEVDNRRGRHLQDGDEVRVDGLAVVVRLPATVR